MSAPVGEPAIVARRDFYVPVLLGTPRKGRHSVHAAVLLATELRKRPGVTTEVIDVLDYPTPPDDAGEQAKNPAFAEKMARMDGLVIVTPEYNRSFPGALKALLDTCLAEYIHKPVGIVGVSAGPFGGTRVIEGLLPTLRELGLVTIFWDVNMGRVGSVFDAAGEVRDEVWRTRCGKFLAELLWMAETLRHGREQIALGE
jgi:NAD(P)H-dependent FMN reductase